MDIGILTAAVARNDYRWVHAEAPTAPKPRRWRLVAGIVTLVAAAFIYAPQQIGLGG
jgi:hypothetical protein